MNASAILDVQRLTKSYRTNSGELTVLKDISFVLGPGATCAILGPSGSGKSTLLGLCAGLDLPTSGQVCLNGIAWDEIGEDERARVRNQLVGFVFQSFQLIPTLTALENVTVPMELRGHRTARRQGLRPGDAAPRRFRVREGVERRPAGQPGLPPDLEELQSRDGDGGPRGSASMLQ